MQERDGLNLNRVATMDEQVVAWVRPQSWATDLKALKMKQEIEADPEIQAQIKLVPNLVNGIADFTTIMSCTFDFEFNIEDKDGITQTGWHQIQAYWENRAKKSNVALWTEFSEIGYETVTYWASWVASGRRPFSMELAQVPADALDEDQKKEIAENPDSPLP